jgi:GNAT superfamily N-acetyltransferase
MAVTVREATADDAELVHALICELAVYERLADRVTGDPALVREWLFGPDPAAEALIAEVDGAVAGFALFHRTFSTFEAKPGIWLEDLFVREQHRKAGAGRALIGRVAEITVARGYTRLEWVALDWNVLALDFYAKLGAEVLADWRMLRLDGGRLALAAAEPEP